MLTAYVARLGDDQLANLEVGEQPEPQARPGWAVVRVAAASLNHHDLFTLRGVSSQPVKPPQILGCDAAGTVVSYAGDPPAGAPAVGARVVVDGLLTCGHCAGCRSGEETLCRTMAMLSEGDHPGTFAELVSAPAGNLIPLPDSVDDVSAACLPTAYLTAYRMLFTKAALRPGMTVLVQGASGGVATAAILLGAAAGLTVFATSRDEAKRALAEELGAVRTFAPERATAKAILTATDGGVDAVIETVGEPTWDLSLRAVRPGGTIVVSGTTGGPNPPAQLSRVFWRQTAILGSTMGTLAELRRLVDLCARGVLTPLVDRSFPLSEAREAFTLLHAGRQRGKLILQVGGEAA
ncbi:MAG: zinc-binding dehydrogenase [Candidatus Dormibacteria bacterium]